MALFKIENLSFSYPNSKKYALKNLNLEINQGEFICICGKSGCGKSTLIKHFKTSITPYGSYSGDIYFNNEKLHRVSDREQAQKIGFVTQNPDNQIVTDKVWHELAFTLENLGYDLPTMRIKVAEMVNYFGIFHLYDKNTNELSGGQKQLLNLASVMAVNPQVLILDEPTSCLDPIASNEFLQVLRKINQELDITIIIIEHNLEEVFSMADKILVLDNGEKIAFDTPKKVIEQLESNDIFMGFPTAVRLFKQISNENNPPLNVKEARFWFNDYIKKNQINTKDIVFNDEIINSKNIVVDTKNIWFRYDKNSDDIIKGTDLKVYENEIFCILGSNGAGKSTFLSLLCNINKAYRGKIFINNADIKKVRQKDIALLPQDPQTLFISDTVKGELYDVLKMMDKDDNANANECITKVLEETKILHLADSHPYDLSGGEQQRVAFAKILLLNPEIILLDEPTKSLDGYHKKTLIDIILNLKRMGKTFIIVSHDVEFCAEIADRCGMFFDGKIEGIKPKREFFANNNFYTTTINRIVRSEMQNAILQEDVVSLC